MQVKSEPESEVLELYRRMESIYDITSLPTKAQLMAWERDQGSQTIANLIYHIVNSKTPRGDQVVNRPAGFMIKTIRSEEIANYSPQNYQRRQGKTSDYVPYWITVMKDVVQGGTPLVRKSAEEDINPEYLEGKQVQAGDIAWLFSKNHQQLYREDASRLMWLYRAGTKLKTLKQMQRYYPKIFGRNKDLIPIEKGEVRKWIAQHTDPNLGSEDSF